MASGINIIPVHSSTPNSETRSYSIFKDEGGNFHLQMSLSSKLEGIMHPDKGMIRLDPETCSRSYSFEAMIPSDTTGRPEDIQVLSMNYQLKASE